MQQCHHAEGSLEAPSPNIPTYRPSSQSPKRSYAMSALAPKYQQYLSMADDIHSSDTTIARTNPENVTEIERLLQTHVTSQTSPSIGPKDMLKAGQRRLKLAFGNRKGTEIKEKTDDGPQQLAAVQHAATFPRSQYRKWGHKRSVASTESIPKSASDLSSKSSSKRDVEKIGRPWLDHPVEKRDEPGSKGSSALSSLDLRDLASFVEAAVNFSQGDDTEPPPYQASKSNATAASTTVDVHGSVTRIPIPHPKGVSRKTNEDLPIASRFNRSGWKSNDNLSIGSKSPEGLRSKGTSMIAANHPPRSSTSSNGSLAPATPNLKLFSDTMPSRTPSQKALRIPADRSPTPNQFFSPATGSQSTSALTGVFNPSTRQYRSSSGSLPKIQEAALVARETSNPNSNKPRLTMAETSIHPQKRQIKHKRRPWSLPPTAIDLFPVPAPVKPLPSLPESETRARDVSKEPFADQQTGQLDNDHPADGTANMPPIINLPSPTSPGEGSSASRGRDSPFPRLFGTKDQAPAHGPTAGPPIPLQPRHGSLGKTGRSREARVRSLIIRDLAKSGHKRSASKDRILEEQLSPPHRIGAEIQAPRPHRSEDPGSRAQLQHRKKIPPGPSSSLAPSPLESKPRRQRQSRRYCSSPAGAMAAAIENYENLSRPSSNTNLRVSRKSNAHHVETKPRKSAEQTTSNQAETPIPSSDEEGPDGSFFRSAPRKAPGRRRREKPSPLIIEKRPERGRSSKSHPATSSMGHLMHRSYKKRAVEKAPQKHLTPDYQSHSHLTPEIKPNPSLEGRIEHLERQNKILQAALLAALDVGVKQDLSSLLGAPPAPTSTETPPLTGTSFSTEASVSDVSSIEQEYHSRGEKHLYRSESWIASPGSFSNGSYDSDAGAEVKGLEQIVDEFDLDWLSDRSSVMD